MLADIHCLNVDDNLFRTLKWRELFQTDGVLVFDPTADDCAAVVVHRVGRPYLTVNKSCEYAGICRAVNHKVRNLYLQNVSSLVFR